MSRRRYKKEQSKNILDSTSKIMNTYLNENVVDRGVVLATTATFGVVGAPVGNLINSARKNFPDITNQLFMTKLEYILTNMAEIDLKTKIEFYNKYVNEKENKFYTNFLLIVNAINNQNKCLLIARFLKAFMYGKISENEWEQINHIILKLSYEDLECISSLKFVKSVDYEGFVGGEHTEEVFVECKIRDEVEKYIVLKNAESVALIHIINIGTLTYASGGICIYQKTDLGMKFFELYKFGELD